MQAKAVSRPDFSARLSFWLLSAFLVILWIAGGASRADVSGQGAVRFFAWAFLIGFVLFSARFEWRRVKPIAILLGLTIVLVALQLLPLPPAIWTALPGRHLLVQAAEVSGQPQPWRPISISPGATANALGSLVVPAVVLVLCAQLSREQQWRIAAVLLALVFAGCILALLQFSGASFANPFINYQVGVVSGNFANRNHFALFIALGCLIAPMWSFRGERHTRWKSVAALALLPFFLLVTFATGSRAGILLAILAIVVGFMMVRANAIRELRTLPRWACVTILISVASGVIGAVVLSLFLGRAVAIDRALDLAVAEDLRSKAFPTIIDMLGHYFPAGTGFGTFDPVYRIGEPDALLQPLYFNHAHNDWLEVVLNGGLAGAVLLGGVLVWVVIATIKAWRRSGQGTGLARTGAIGLLLVMLASIPDYPARTPMIMAIIVIAGVWLHSGTRSSRDF
ncbi:O-antigen ligase family protein [Qipengyuania sp.]|uniref:O-antigen ligase family protein n=1 Tax=Qipengyuania sp. TaxID=2004515 RepID=UPI0035C86D8D